MNLPLPFAGLRDMRAKRPQRAGGTQDIVAFEHPGISLTSDLTRAAFDTWIEEELAQIDQAVNEALARAGIAQRDVDRVFTTGGSSFVPAVRARLSDAELAELLDPAWHFSQVDTIFERVFGPDGAPAAAARATAAE